MYICLCVSVYVNMHLRVWYRNSSSKNESLSIMGDYKSSK